MKQLSEADEAALWRVFGPSGSPKRIAEPDGPVMQRAAAAGYVIKMEPDGAASPAAEPGLWGPTDIGWLALEEKFRDTVAQPSSQPTDARQALETALAEAFSCDVAEYRRIGGITGVRLGCAATSCGAKPYLEGPYSLDNLPQMPHPLCKDAATLQCFWLAIHSFDPQPGRWLDPAARTKLARELGGVGDE